MNQNTQNMLSIPCLKEKTTVYLNGAEVDMELDTIASLSVISQVTYQQSVVSSGIAGDEEVRRQTHTYTGERVPIAGAINVNVAYKNQEKEVELLVVQGSGPNLMGRNWLKVLYVIMVKPLLNWSHLYQVKQPTEKWHENVNRHPEAFQEEFGRVKQVKAKIYVDPPAKPSFYKP